MKTNVKRTLILVTTVGSILALLKLGSANSKRVAEIKAKFKKDSE